MEASAEPPKQQDFHPIPFPVRNLTTTHATHYRVYSDTNHFIAVEANTAAEAIKLSNITDPILVKRDVPEQQTLLDMKNLLH